MSGVVTVAGARYFQRILFGQSEEPHSSYWIALTKSMPTVFNVADELDEVDIPDSGYARIEIPNDGEWWKDSVSISRTNAQDLIFDSALTDWGTIKYWALCSQEDGGDVFSYGNLEVALDVRALDRVVIQTGSLSFALNVLYRGD